MRARCRALTEETAAMHEQLIDRSSDEERLKRLLAVKCEELVEERAQLSTMSTDVETIPALAADNKRLAAQTAELVEANAQLTAQTAELIEANAALTGQLDAVKGETSRFKAAHGPEAVEELKASASRQSEALLRLEVTVCQQMELLTFQAERADVKDKAAAELHRAGERKDAEILELRHRLTETATKLEHLRRAGARGASAEVGVMPGGGVSTLATASNGADSSSSADWVRRQFEWNQKALKRLM